MTSEEIVIKLTDLDGTTHRHEGRIKELEKRQGELEQLTRSVAVMAERQERMESDVQDIKADLNTLAEKPAKRWDSLVDKLFWAVAAAVIGAALAYIGLR